MESRFALLGISCHYRLLLDYEKYHDTYPIRLPRQHLQEPYGAVHIHQARRGGGGG